LSIVSFKKRVASSILVLEEASVAPFQSVRHCPRVRPEKFLVSTPAPLLYPAA